MQPEDPDSISCIIGRENDSGIKHSQPHTFLVYNDMVMEDVYDYIREQNMIEPSRPLHIFCNHTLPLKTQSLEQLYGDYRDEDGHLYFTYSDKKGYTTARADNITCLDSEESFRQFRSRMIEQGVAYMNNLNDHFCQKEKATKKLLDKALDEVKILTDEKSKLPKQEDVIRLEKELKDLSSSNKKLSEMNYHMKICLQHPNFYDTGDYEKIVRKNKIEIQNLHRVNCDLELDIGKLTKTVKAQKKQEDQFKAAIVHLQNLYHKKELD